MCLEMVQSNERVGVAQHLSAKLGGHGWGSAVSQWQRSQAESLNPRGKVQVETHNADCVGRTGLGGPMI